MTAEPQPLAVPTLWPPAGPVTLLPGVGPATALRLQQAGLQSLLDLLLVCPRRYRELQALRTPDAAALGALVRLPGTVRGTRLAWLPGRRAMVTVEFAAPDGTPFAAAFFNQPWLRRAYTAGQERTVEGVLARRGAGFVLKQARILPAAAAAAGAVQLRYPEIEGITLPRLQQWIALALARLDYDRVDLPPLPPGLDDHQLSARELLQALHRPATVAEHERARTHFALREAVRLFAAVDRARAQRAARTARAYPVDGHLDGRIRARLPFRLTADQETALAALRQRLLGPAPMGVLLQGDVGVGKTAVAVATALAVLAHGHQVAFLAPTELLAEQHHAEIARWLDGSDVGVELLTAACKPAERAALQARLLRGGPLLVVGTHALLTEALTFARLGLVIIDEQQRFGVAQRMALVHKGADPHVLVLTATPIPRTLALCLFGDLDALPLRQRPPGRRPVPARHLEARRWPRALQSMARAVRRGGRVFVVCPAVGEDGEKGGAVRVHAQLAQHFACRLVHGRMPAAARQAALLAFRAGDCDVLVGTTVLEVGVDVPAATLMVVVAADRFGIATLHQLRGRVGRGVRRGLCILCGPATPRVQATCRTTDGFELAEEDLRLRGSGELLGTAQSGFAELRALDPVEDLPLLLRARAAVKGGAACES